VLRIYLTYRFEAGKVKANLTGVCLAILATQIPALPN